MPCCSSLAISGLDIRKPLPCLPGDVLQGQVRPAGMFYQPVSGAPSGCLRPASGEQFFRLLWCWSDSDVDKLLKRPPITFAEATWINPAVLPTASSISTSGLPVMMMLTLYLGPGLR